MKSPRRCRGLKNCRRDVAVGFFSIEMSKSELLQWLWSHERMIPFEYIRKPAMGLGRDAIAGLLVVDYVQLISANAPNERAGITKISNQIRALAKDTGVPIVAVSQLNRPKDRNPNERPNKFSMKESGSLENDTNTILLIYRPMDDPGRPDGGRRAQRCETATRSGEQRESRFRFEDDDVPRPDEGTRGAGLERGYQHERLPDAGVPGVGSRVPCAHKGWNYGKGGAVIDNRTHQNFTRRRRRREAGRFSRVGEAIGGDGKVA